MTNRPKRWFLLLILITALNLVVGCYRGDETEKNFESRYYMINPMTILDSLDRGDTNVFTLMKTTPQATSSPSSESVTWSQADYLRIVQNLYQKVWQEPFEEQNIYGMDFSLSCSEIKQGLFSEANIHSYKVIQTGKEETRVEYETWIKPSDHYVRTLRDEFTPNIQKREPIDLTQHLISAEEALQIAEKNGAANQRLKYDNACLINVIASGSDGKDWEVIYVNSQDKFKTLFDITIDPRTGVFKVIYPKP